MGVLTTADALALECLCEAYADLLSARTALAKRGASLSYETKTKEGGVMHRAYPEVAMVSDADRRFVMHLGRFGLTPADRSRVSAHGGGADENPFAAFG
jgi:P27 family predicted phage terminase small subunit